MDAGIGKTTGWRAGFVEDYRRVFVEEWSPYFGVVVIVLAILALMTNGLFWGIYGGLRLWGDWFNKLIGLGAVLGLPARLDSPLMHQMSLMNIVLVAGAFAAALMSRQFTINRPPKLEVVWAALGGSLMGFGATLAGGCTTGGFFTPVLHSSPAGWAMWIGLIVGAYIGLKLLLWTLENVEWGMEAPPTIAIPAGVQKLFPYLGLLIFVGIVVWTASWYLSPERTLMIRAIVVIAGFVMGFTMHRSRLCFARSFREPFMTGEGTMTKAIMLGILVGIPMAALLFRIKAIDPYVPIPPTFWIGSLLGGLVFGVGMVFAGGCASGALWRMGEGHLKLWVATFFFAWTGSIAYALLHKVGLNISEDNLDDPFNGTMTKLGVQAYLPNMLNGWVGALAVAAVLLAVWYAFVRYNETTEKFTVL